MKKALRMLSIGAIAAFSAASFAQTNVTNKVLNADMEKGIIGWDITFDGTDIWKKTTKNQASQPSYYGMNNLCLEVWKANAEPATNTSLSQTLKNLPNGTYVFGAYMAATDQQSIENRETIEGVTIFANDATTRVATNTVQNMDTVWAHAAKFNVAVAVTDGTLRVGVDLTETNASFVILDNATLYFFGDKEPAAALDEMAKIDIANTLAIADTCLHHKMNASTLAALNEAIETAKTLTTDAELYTADEILYWGIRQALNSSKDYTKLAQTLKNAKEVASQEWSEFVAEAVATLNTLIEEAETAYNEGNVERAEIDTIAKYITEAIASVELDNVYNNLDLYGERIDDLEIGDNVGEYTEEMSDRMNELLNGVSDILSQLEEGLITAAEAISSSNALFRQIDELIDTPNTADEFPLTIARSSEPLNNKTIMRGSYLDENGLAHFKSKTYAFDYPLQKLRFVIKQNGNNSNNNGYPFVALSDFAMYDEYGDPIELTTDMVTSNAEYNALNPGKQDGMGIAGLLDGDLTTYFHSAYANGPAEYHYIEVTLPEDEYYAFSFTMAARSNSEFHTGQFPAEMEIQHLSEAAADLEAAIAEAKKFKPYFGVEPGFYNTDVTLYKEAIAEAEALVDSDASDSEVYAAIDKMVEVRTQIEEVGIVMPDPEKEYRIVAGVEFFKFQGVHKAISLFNGGGYYNQLGWQTANPDSLVQLFKFEPMESGDDRFTYALKHVASGKYVGRFFNEEGDEVPNAFGLSEEPEEVELVSLGEGQFGIKCGELAGNNNSNMMHTNGYNNGNGNANTLVKWNTGANGGSAWYIREMCTLPCAAKSISDLQFESERIHLYSAVNTIILTADKECAFEGLKLYDLHGDILPTTVTTNGATATVMLDTKIETFSFAFTNAEEIASVTVNGSISTLSILQQAYTEALAVAPTQSDEVGKYGDISEYETAIENAENLLAKGGSDEEIQQAVEALEAAVANLGKYINYPKADKEYFLLAGYQEFKKINGIDMAIFCKQDFIRWSYVNISDNTYRWRFVASEPTADGKPTFYIQNVGTEMYAGVAEEIRLPLDMADDPADTKPYIIHSHTDGSAALTTGNGMFFHFNSHNNGAGACGDVIYWNGAGGASAIRFVEADKFIDEYLKEMSVEHIDINNQPVAPAVKGIYDLFGRRIDTPATTGIYIVDGVKTVIKK